MLHLLFGDTVLAVSTVLASFMAGLAIGSFWIGRHVDRRPRVLPLYAWLEAGIGLAAIVLPVALDSATPLYVWLHRHLAGWPGLFAAGRFALAFSLLCVPTAFMGATLPVLSRYAVKNTSTLGWKIGTLYALNTAGAVVGCFATGYVLLGRYGLSRTVWIAAALNLSIALVVWIGQRWAPEDEREDLLRDVRPGAPDVPPTAPREAAGADVAGDARAVRLALGCFALSGFCALSYEVIWARALTFFIGNSTYALSAMLTTVLCGLALGSFLGARVSDRPMDRLALLGGLQVGIGVYGLVSIAILGRVFYGLDAWWDGFSNAYWGTPLWLTFAKTFAVILPPTLAMGAAFPLVARIAARGPAGVGRTIGAVYAANTLGAIAGSIMSGFVALPLLGIHQSLAATALVSVGVGAALLASSGMPRLHQGLVHAGVVLLFALVMMAAPVLRFADIAGEPERTVLHYAEDAVGVVKVATDVYDRKLLSINGWSVAGTATPNPDIALVNDYPEVQKLLAHLPMLLHPAPRRALVIGFGAGGTSWSFSRYPALERLDIAEFVPNVIRAARFFPEVNHGVLVDPRVHVTIDDGRNVLLVTDRTWDVVSVDTLDPKHAGNGNLYTQEFYELSRRALAPGGIFVQWLPYHQVDNASLKTIARTFQHVYPHATVWLNRFKGYALLLGTQAPLSIDLGRLEAHFRTPAIQSDLAEIHVANPWQFLESFAMRPETLRRFTAGDGRLNTYDRPRVEFYGMSWSDPVEENLSELGRFADDVAPLLSFPADYTPAERERALEQVALHRRISRHIFRGYLASWHRQLQEGTREYRKALRLDPHDEGVKFALGVASVHKREALAALDRRPGDVKSLGKLGYIAWSEGDYDEAIRRFREVLAVDSGNAAAYIHLGVSYAARERFDDSMAAYREAARLKPDLATLADQSTGLVDLLKRVKEHPGDAAALGRLGDLYAGDGRSERAIECFEKVVALSPREPENFFKLARQYEAEDRDADAARAFSQGLALDPANVPARNNREKLAIKMALEGGRPVSVPIGGDQMIRIDPDQGASYYQLGLRYLRNDEAGTAVAVLRQAVALEPRDADAHLFLGLAYVSLGAYAPAEAALRRSIALRPGDPPAYNYLGLVLQQQRRYPEALAAYRKAIEQDPAYAVAYVNLAASHEALGQTAEALAAYQQALSRDPNLAAIQEKVDALEKKPAR